MYQALPWLMGAMGGAGAASAVPGTAFAGMPEWMKYLEQAVQSPNPEAAAPMLAQAGDPNAMMSLFGDTNQWSPLMPESDPLLRPQPVNTQGSFDIALANATGATNIPGQTREMQQRPKPGLTPEQQQMLLGQMPDQRGNYMPAPAAPSPGRPQLQGSMQQLQAGTVQPQRRLSLADLIYGAR